MKYAFTVSALLALVAAQGIGDLPQCSLSCILAGVPQTGCDVTDFKCACGKADILTPAITPCVQKECTSPADQAKVITVLEGICASVGVPITIPNPGQSSAPAPASSTEAPAPASSSGGAPTATDVVPTVTLSTKPSATAPYPIPSGGSSSHAPTGTSPPSVSSSSPAFTGAAAAVNVPAGVAGVLGFLAYVL